MPKVQKFLASESGIHKRRFDSSRVTTVQSDVDGDGTWDQVSTATTTILANGTRQIVTVAANELGAVMNRAAALAERRGLLAV